MEANFRHNSFLCSGIRGVVAAVCLVVLAVAMTSCRGAKTVTIEKPVYVHDTAYINKEIHDSTYIDRWHTIEVKGDTVRWRDSVVMYRYIIKTDTAYKYVEVPVTVKETESVEVKKPLNWLQKTMMWLGVGFILVVIGFGVSLFVKLKGK